MAGESATNDTVCLLQHLHDNFVVRVQRTVEHHTKILSGDSCMDSDVSDLSSDGTVRILLVSSAMTKAAQYNERSIGMNKR